MSNGEAIKYQRVLLKLSGEALMGDNGFGHDVEVMRQIVRDVKDVIDYGIKICIVVGGGNIYRGSKAAEFGIERATADYIGMLGTMINALAMQSLLESADLSTRVLSAIPMQAVCEPYVRNKARHHMEKGRVVIFAAGSGNPFFTTDTAGVLRAIEMNCDILLKATKVDGVYSADPYKNKITHRYDEISYSEVIKQKLNVMDMAAVALAMENNLPLKVFSIKERGNLLKVLKGECKFTKIYGG